MGIGNPNKASGVGGGLGSSLAEDGPEIGRIKPKLTPSHIPLNGIKNAKATPTNLMSSRSARCNSARAQ